MPQLDFATYAPQLIWLTITFAVLYVLMARVAMPRIGGVIEQRRDRIASDLDQAAKLKEETEEAIAAYETALAEAKAEALRIAQENRDRLNAETEAQRAELEAALAAKIAEAEERIASMRQAALAQINEVAADTAAEIVRHLIGGRITRARVQKALAEAAE